MRMCSGRMSWWQQRLFGAQAGDHLVDAAGGRMLEPALLLCHVDLQRMRQVVGERRPVVEICRRGWLARRCLQRLPVLGQRAPQA